jgi:alpha-L-fucosidase
MWFDFSWRTDVGDDVTDPLLRGKDEEDWQSESLLALIRSLQPEILINNRLSSRRNLGDIRTPEQSQQSRWVRDPETGELAVWEVCHTFSGAWGYHRDEHSWKTPRMMIETLIRTVSHGGNLLLNVGPTARGVFDERATERLEGIGKWMRFHSRSIVGCTQAEECFRAPDGCLLTESDDGKRLYVHLLSYPLTYLVLDDLADRIEYAQLMHDGSELSFRTNYRQTGQFTAKAVEGAVTITLPMPPPPDEIPVVEIFLK